MKWRGAYSDIVIRSVETMFIVVAWSTSILSLEKQNFDAAFGKWLNRFYYISITIQFLLSILERPRKNYLRRLPPGNGENKCKKLPRQR